MPASKLLAEHLKPAEIAAVTRALPDTLYAEQTYDGFLMIMSRRAVKSEALRTLCAHFGIPLADVAAFGDDHNDTAMLKACGMGVAVANAEDAVKAAADEVCASNDCDGVAKWIDARLLAVRTTGSIISRSCGRVRPAHPSGCSARGRTTTLRSLLLPQEVAAMTDAVSKMHAFYAHTPNAPLYQREFGFYVMDRWIREGHVLPESATPDRAAYLRTLFSYDDPAVITLTGCGGCEAALYPRFEEKVLEDRGAYELVQDFAGRHVLCFKGRRSGFMPEYVSHPVKDQKTFEDNILWRMNPLTPNRFELTAAQVQTAAACAKDGFHITQYVVGGYMYLRSLIGPEPLLYMFYDDPDLIHRCMQAWLTLNDAVIAHHQKSVAIDEILFDEDICYKNGSLISPDMIREFLLPYYDQLVSNTGRRNPDAHRPLVQLATDGYCVPVISLYKTIGCAMVSPFEIAAGQDIVEIGRQFPDLLMTGGIDKRVLATTPAEIDAYLDRVLPAMKARGGYIPTCDHGVPEEVSFENYMHYRKRMLEYAE
jgi:hypothetical protein